MNMLDQPIHEIFPEAYSPLLKQIPRLPPKLYCIGEPPQTDQQIFLTIIGSRRNSAYGREVCKSIIRGLAGYPITIVSGLANGIDSLSHESALEFGLKTVAFPGSGLNEQSIYPQEKLGLAREIIRSGGALLSPFAPDQLGTLWTFPARNRLMAGFSHATLIIEARQGSGTLLTAGYALDFGRDIFAVPGSIFSDLSYGPHLLIRDGAVPVTSAKDILEHFGLLEKAEDQKTENKKVPKIHTNIPTVKIIPQNLSLEEKAVFGRLGSACLSAEELLDQTGLSSVDFNKALSGLEIAGLIIINDSCLHLANLPCHT